MTAKKAQISTMILLVVPLGFSTGTELLKTMAHKSHTDFPIVKVEPPASDQNYGRGKKERKGETLATFFPRQRRTQQRTEQGLTADEPAVSN